MVDLDEGGISRTRHRRGTAVDAVNYSIIAFSPTNVLHYYSVALINLMDNELTQCLVFFLVKFSPVKT